MEVFWHPLKIGSLASHETRQRKTLADLILAVSIYGSVSIMYYTLSRKDITTTYSRYVLNLDHSNGK